MSDPPLLELAGVTRRFAIRGGIAGRIRGHVSAVRDVSLTVRRGEVFGLAGESGSGKSTIARMIVGLARPDAGTIRFAGRPVAESREIQMVFQNPGASLNPRRSVGQSLAVPLAAAGTGRAARRARIADLLGLVQLPADTASRYPHELSGGQKQRVAIARAIAASPRLLVLDEPTSALDVSVQAKIMELLVELGRSLGLTYIFISHDLSLMRNFADRVGVLYLGEVVESGTTEALFGNPAHPYTRTLLASIPVVSPEEARLRPDIPLIEGEIPNAADLPAGCVFHPRCPYAFAPCASVHPGFVRAAAGQMARCHLLAGGEAAVHDMTTREQPA
jgi:peptide/nickel transport system ATP-binding protein